jgi:RNA polymerase sigma-70 factor (ECF subfamily)
MFHICRSYARTTDEAQDILQESFLKVFRNLESYSKNSSLEG